MKSPRSLCFPFLLIAFLFSNAPSVFAQVPSEIQIDSIAQRGMRLFQVPGLAVGIIKDGKLIYSKGFGVRSLRTQLPVTSKTLFGIASNTKAFTAAALGLLVDEGKLQWDDKVIKYIPEFKLYDAYATQELTIRDLLCHRSGLATGAGDLMHDPDSTDFTVKDIIYNLRFIKPAYSFRSKFAYDNNLYLVAGEIIARVSKMRWEDFIEQRLLQPLQMNSSAASYNDCKLSANIIDPHNKVNDTTRVVTRYTSTKDDAAGGIYSNVEDLSKWALMLMNSGRHGDKQLLSEQTAKQLWTPQTNIPVGNGGIYHTHFAAYGLGWFVLDVKGYKQIFHTGQDVGMVSEISMIPEIGLGIIVLTNNESNAAYAIADQITDGYLGVTGTDRCAEDLTRSQNNEKKTAERKAEVWKQVHQEQGNKISDIKKYTGNYHDKWFGNISITLRYNRLWFASQRSSQFKGWLYPYQKDTFVFKWQNSEIDADTFVLFGNGNKRTITLQSIVAGGGYNFESLLFEKLP
ncbi:serine hydrolase [Mucilaginibacter lappiensis]|uniref:CubicO group peptidase (Beta-lactamase class C family) n=1 Tax=Mucilaginibacter lappiensis TaxID=354630 RepID=A0A841JKH6_9SPHI|nr:serine hydrolase [Mucilaginibacter lappiensis]MBB6130964.1 CubicO group peptidase (beta-lactamase class C family) [Mucilaginibacter lappiensis]